MVANLPALKAKRLPFYVIFKENLKRFLIETSLNGLKYLADAHRSVWERGYYLTAFTTVFVAGLYMALYIFQKWQSTPVIIGISSNTTSIQDLPFPAVTFCNMNQALASKVKNIQVDTPEYAMLQQTCLRDYNYTRFANFQPRSEDDDLVNFKIQNSQNCSDMIIYCKYGPYEEPCTNLFRDVILDDGICCVFNRLHPFFLYNQMDTIFSDYTSLDGRTNIPVNWNLEAGYKEPLPISYYPRKAVGSGVSMGLTVALYADIDEYFCSSTNCAGFKVLLYNPIDSPYIRETGLPIMIGQQTRLIINSRLMESQPSLRNIKPEARQCYFSNEKKLLYYKYYTRRCCEAECNALQMLRLCKCIPHYFPKVVSNAAICFLGDMDCVMRAERLTLEPEIRKCKAQCLPGCHDLQYFPDAFVSPLAVGDYNLQDTYFRNISKEEMHKNIALVHIFYKDNYLRGNTRVPYMGLAELLAQTGGVMSLMVGFSVISIVELFFFMLLKPFLDILTKRNPKLFESKDEVKEKNLKHKKVQPQLFLKRRKIIFNRVLPLEQNHAEINRPEKY